MHLLIKNMGIIKPNQVYKKIIIIFKGKESLGPLNLCQKLITNIFSFRKNSKVTNKDH